MEENKKALNEQSEEKNTPDTTPVAEEKVSEEAKPITEPIKEEIKKEVKEEAKTDEEPRKGYSKRVRELNAKAKAEAAAREKAEAKAQSLAEKVAELTGSVEPQAGIQPIQPLQQEPIVAPGEEIDALELDKRLREREQQQIRRTDALITLRGKQQDAINRITRESNEAVRDYPELDPESDSFNKNLSETVTEAVEAHIKANPYQASVKKFVGKLMKPYREAVAKEAGEVTEKLAKQSSQSALKPSSIRKDEKPVEDMTKEELEEKLGIVQT